MVRQLRERINAQNLLLFKDLWKAKRDIKKLKDEAKYAIKDKNRRLADIFSQLQES